MTLPAIDRVSGVILLMISIFLLIEVSGPQYAVSAVDEGVNPGFLPKVLLSFWLVLALILIVRPSAKSENARVHVEWRKFYVFAVMTVGYFIIVWSLGFVWATGIFLSLCPMLLGYRPYWGSLLFGISSTAALWVAFEKLFRLILPTGQVWG